MNQCFCSGDVTTSSVDLNGNSFVGGIVGICGGAFGKSAEVNDCYSTGNVSGIKMVGGISGRLGRDTGNYGRCGFSMLCCCGCLW